MKKFLFIALLFGLFVSCKKNNPASASASTMNVTINGTTYSWGAGGVKGTTSGGTLMTLDGTDGTGKNEKIIVFSLTNIAAAGTYNITNDKGLNSQSVTMSYHPDTTASYDSEIGANPAGTFTVTSITSSSISATFNAVLHKENGKTNDSTVTITNGSLEINTL